MKNQFVLLYIMCFCFLLLSCKKDHPSNNPTNNSAVDSVDEWEYLTHNATPSNNNPALYFYNDGAGVIAGSSSVGYSVDSGVTWASFDYGTSILPQTNDYGGLSVYGGNLCTWIPQYPSDIVYVEYVQGYSPGEYPTQYAGLDTISSIPHLSQRVITGVYAYGTQSGYVLTQEGNIYNINAGFSPSNISLEYQSKYYSDAGPNYTMIMLFDKLEALDPNDMMAIGNPAGPVLIHKRNGVYTEYNLTNQLGAGIGIRDMQYVDANTAYLLGGNGQLYRYANDSNLVNLPYTVNISRFRFINDSVGYASVYINTSPYGIDNADSYIYKTVNGGISWAQDFALNSDEKITSFFVNGNEVWALGLDNYPTGSETGFILKLYKTIATPSSPSSGGVITADVDGVPTTFSSNVSAVQTYSDGTYGISISATIPAVQAVNGGDQIGINMGGTAPITVGTYNDGFVGPDVEEISYTPVGLTSGDDYGGTGTSPYITTVTITSIDSSKIRGTFSGDLTLWTGSGPSSISNHVITNGTFNLPLTQGGARPALKR